MLITNLCWQQGSRTPLLRALLTGPTALDNWGCCKLSGPAAHTKIFVRVMKACGGEARLFQNIVSCPRGETDRAVWLQSVKETQWVIVDGGGGRREHVGSSQRREAILFRSTRSVHRLSHGNHGDNLTPVDQTGLRTENFNKLLHKQVIWLLGCYLNV